LGLSSADIADIAITAVELLLVGTYTGSTLVLGDFVMLT